MSKLSGKEKFFTLFLLTHLVSIKLSIITTLITDLLTGLISYLAYIHISAATAYLSTEKYGLELEGLSHKPADVETQLNQARSKLKLFKLSKTLEKTLWTLWDFRKSKIFS
ncbi:MAG: hypothetical protein ABEK04_02730 [Candidatus Nanohalobium sp.]